MSTRLADPGADPGAPTTYVVLRRTCAAEWWRIRTVRSTWVFALVTALLMLGLATVAGVDISSETDVEATPWDIAQVTGMLGLFGILAISLVTATADHGTGGIVPTLQWTPRRRVLLAARAGVVVGVTTLFGALLVSAAALVVLALVPDMGLGLEEAPGTLGRAAGVYAAAAALSVGIGLATRSTAGGLAIVVGLMLVLPLLLQLFPYDWVGEVIARLPGAGALYLMVGEGPGDTTMTATSAALTLAAWAVVALVLGGWRLLRTDADH